MFKNLCAINFRPDLCKIVIQTNLLKFQNMKIAKIHQKVVFKFRIISLELCFKSLKWFYIFLFYSLILFFMKCYSCCFFKFSFLPVILIMNSLYFLRSRSIPFPSHMLRESCNIFFFLVFFIIIIFPMFLNSFR